MDRRIIMTSLLAIVTLQSCAQKSEKQRALKLKNSYDVIKADIGQTADVYGLKGNVKTVEQLEYVVPEDSVIDFSEYEAADLSEDAHYHLLAGAGMNNDCKLTFDGEGKLLYRMARGERFSSDAVETDTLHYNAAGDLAQINNRLVGDDFVFDTDIIFEYDAHGHLIRKLHNDQLDIEYTYDEAKNQVRVVWYDNGQFMSDNVYTYDKFGLVMETHNYNEGGSLKLRWVHEYDDYGHIIREFQHYPNGETHELKKPKEDKTIKVYRQYDGNGNCTKRLIVDSNGRISMRERKFEYYP